MTTIHVKAERRHIMPNLTINRSENHNDRSAAHQCRMIIAFFNRFEQDSARRSLYICTRTHIYIYIHIHI